MACKGIVFFNTIAIPFTFLSVYQRVSPLFAFAGAKVTSFLLKNNTDY